MTGGREKGKRRRARFGVVVALQRNLSMLLPKPQQWCTSHPSCNPPKSSCMERMRPTKGSMGWGGQEGIKSRKEKESVLQDSLRCHVNPVLPYTVAVGQICRWVFGQHEKLSLEQGVLGVEFVVAGLSVDPCIREPPLF